MCAGVKSASLSHARSILRKILKFRIIFPDVIISAPKLT